MDSGQPRTPYRAAWYPDPTGRHQHRYHDGNEWTHHVADEGRSGQDPLSSPAEEPRAEAPGAAPAAAAGAPPGAWVDWQEPAPQGGALPATERHPAPTGQPASPTPQQGTQPWQQAPPPRPGSQPWQRAQPTQPGAQPWPQHGAQPWQQSAPAGGLAMPRQPTPPGGVTMTEAVRRCLTKYVDFTGRAPRSEYWWFALATGLVHLTLAFVAGALGGVEAADVATFLFSLAVLLPALAVAVRRLHDTGRSGWWILIGFVPLVGPILLIVFTATEGSRRPNRYGPPVSH